MPEVYRVFVGAAAMLHAELINLLSQKNRKVWEETDRDMISSQGVLDSNVPLHQQSNGSCHPLGSLHLCFADAFSSALAFMI